jgi:hypothetical protein
LSLGPRKLTNLYENVKGFDKKNPKNCFIFKLSEIITFTKPHVVVFSKKLPYNPDAKPKSRWKQETMKEKNIFNQVKKYESLKISKKNQKLSLHSIYFSIFLWFNLL